MLKNQEKTKHSEYYQRNKEKRNIQAKEYYEKKKKQAELANKKHYQANSIKVLLSFKEYTELNQQKKKLWLDFCWTIQDCQKGGDIVQIQKIEQLADNLIRDYYQTAKDKSKIKGNWNSLSEKQQAKLIKYWAQEKVRKEKELTEQLTEQENQGKEYEKEIELAKFHEERGKVNCECYYCENKKTIQGEIKEQMLNNQKQKQKEQCPECQKWVKELDEENGMCRKCVKKYEG